MAKLSLVVFWEQEAGSETPEKELPRQSLLANFLLSSGVIKKESKLQSQVGDIHALQVPSPKTTEAE